MAQIIACCAQKGGCAKTVTVHNLSTAFKRMGKSVLAVDFDTQASLTTCFGLNPDHVPVNIADLMDVQIHDEELPSRSEYIHHCGGVDLMVRSRLLLIVPAMEIISFWKTMTATRPCMRTAETCR